MKNYPARNIFIPLMLSVLAVFTTIVQASSFHTSTKDCTPTPCTTTGTGSFAIASAQTVRWSATWSGELGNDFYLSTVGPNSADILIDDDLNSGFNSGEFFLNPGNYFIAINTSNMGPGTYTIEYNLVADCNVTPLSFNFGDHEAGSAVPDHSFTISLAGDNLDVTIGSISGTDNAHFPITGGAGATLHSSGPTSVSFDVDFVPGATAGNFSSTITITTTNPSVPVPDKTITVTGETVPLVPNIDCVTSGQFNLDWFTEVSGTFNKSFENEGNATLNVTAITLGNNPSGVFALNGAPSTAPLGEGASRAVSIRFTPPDGEATYSGSIFIDSDSPGETHKECTFTARAHHPEPNMEVLAVPDGGMTADYHDVEIGFTFTKGIKVRNSGDAPLNLTLNLVDPADADRPQWSEINEPNNVIIAAGSEQVFLQRFTPLAEGGPYTIAIEAHGTGGSGTYDQTETVTLTGSGINPIPIDNVLVLDRSGSMADPAGSRTKIDALQKAGRLYYDLLRTDPGDGSGDQIGMVKYSTDDAPYLSPIQMKNAVNEPAVLDLLFEAAITDPARLKPDGWTCIGCGMETGAAMLVASPDTRKQVMVVMTDGIQNRDPRVNDVLGTIETDNPDLQIYSIGLGDDIEDATLQEITNVGNGYHQVSEDLLGTNHFALEEFYFKIWSNATGADLIVDPTEGIDLSAGVPVEVNRAAIVSSDRYAVFMVLDDPALSSYYKLEFIDPHGTILDPTSSVGGIPIQILKRSGHTIYKIIFPDISQAHDYVGDWILRLSPTGKWKPGREDSTRHKGSHSNYDVPGEWIQPYQGIVPIGFGAAVKSDYNMQVSVTANNYQPGADVLLTATLSDRGWPSIGGHIEVTATRPNNSNNNFVLYDDGTHGDANANDGNYTNGYNNTALEGSYRFFFDGKGINERGELVPRQATRYVSLFAPGHDDDGRPDDREDCFPCWLHYLMLLLLLILLWLIVRCCRRMKG